MDIGKKIKHLRLINNMTQEDIASQFVLCKQKVQRNAEKSAEACSYLFLNLDFSISRR
jgi:transcriptional regulator with XRE-family HTH domain